MFARKAVWAYPILFVVAPVVAIAPELASTTVAIVMLSQVVAAVAVFIDAQRRDRYGFFWAVGSVLLAFVVIPVYLIVTYRADRSRGRAQSESTENPTEPTGCQRNVYVKSVWG